MQRTSMEYKKSLWHSFNVLLLETFHNSRLHSNDDVKPSVVEFVHTFKNLCFFHAASKIFEISLIFRPCILQRITMLHFRHSCY